MPLKLGLSTLGSVRLGPNRLKRVMVGDQEVWGSWDPFYQLLDVAQHQPPLRAWSMLGEIAAPHDMVARVKVSGKWRGGYANQVFAIAVAPVGTTMNWVSYVQTGQAAMAVERTFFLSAGDRVSFLSYNNTSSGVRWIDGGYCEVQSVNAAPQTSGGVHLTELDRNTWTQIGNFRAHRAMKVDASITNFSWRQSSSNFSRRITIAVNGDYRGTTSVNEATSYSRKNLVLNKGDYVNFLALSDSDNAGYRQVSDGTWSVKIL